MLGSFDLRAGDIPVTLPPSVERVVAYVALHPGPATRPNVAGNLWMDVPERRAMANLRSALWRLRRPGLSIVAARGDYLALAPEVQVDTYELVSAAHGLIDGDAGIDGAALDRLTAPTELLGDWYEDWVLVEREHVRQLRLQALEQLALRLAGCGDYGRATESALAAVSTEPLRESAHRALISVHLAQGNRSEAIRQYGIYRRIMREELDLEPSPLMTQLVAEIPEASLARGVPAMMAR